MIKKSLLVVVTVLLFASPAFTQFGQSNRLQDLASRLSRDAEEFADSSYNGFSNNNSRFSRNDVEAVMLAYQFAGASRIFYRMTVDRRRNQDLRDAFSVLQNLARSVERNNTQRSTWYNIQRSLQDIARELNSDSSGGGGGQYPDSGGRGGRMTWRGRVDDDVRIKIRGGSADVETLGGTPYYDSQPNFENSLPNRRVTVRLTEKRGRGEISIEQQPSRENDFTAVIRIRDTKGGASDYAFTLEW
jgi:type II secretory pathway pseudopilin PulG